MSSRIRDSDLEERQTSLNEKLEALGSNYRIRIGGRYGYTAIDLYDKNGAMMRCITSGLKKREAYDMLDFALSAIALLPSEDCGSLLDCTHNNMALGCPEHKRLKVKGCPYGFHIDYRRT